MDKRIRELRRGILPVIVLISLSKGPRTVHEIIDFFEENGMDMPIGTIYPLIKRLEKEGLVESRRRTENLTRPAKEYRLSENGQRLLEDLKPILTNILKKTLELLWDSQSGS